MDVSKVSMVTPKQIDWRKLTAKDIIKYDAEGMDIPSQYLQWARAFRVDLEKNDTDNTTYEMAVSKSGKNAKPKKVSNQVKQVVDSPKNKKSSEDKVKEKDTKKEITQTVTQEQDAEGELKVAEVKTDNVVEKTSTDDEPTDTNSNPQNKPVEEMTAAERLKYMKEVQKEDDRTILNTFKDISETKAEGADTASSSLDDISQDSSAANESVESFMQSIMSEARALESKMQSAKDGKKGVNIIDLKEQIEKLGVEAQTMLLEYEGIYDIYASTLDSFEGLGSDSIDYGNQTIELAEKFPLFEAYRSNILFKNRAKAAGKKAVGAGNDLNTNKNSAVETNNSNKSNLSSRQAEVTSVTGVSVSDVKKDEGAKNDGQNPETKQQPQNPLMQVLQPIDGKTADKGLTKMPDVRDTKVEPKPDVQEARIQERIVLDKKAEDDKSKTNETDAKKTEVEKKEEKVASGSLDEILKRKIRKGEEV